MTAIGQIAYVVLILVVYCAWITSTYRFGRYLRRPSSVGIPNGTMPGLAWPDLAYLAGGKLQVFQAALVWLVQQGVLEYDPKTRIVQVLKPLSDATPDSCIQLYHLVQKGVNSQEQVDSIRDLVGDRRGQLIEQGLSYPAERRAGLVTFAVLQLPLSFVPFVAMCFGTHLFFGDHDGLHGTAGLVALAAFAGGGVIFWYSFFLFVHLCNKRHASIWGERVLKENLKSVWPNRPFFFPFHAPPAELQRNLALAVAAFGETTIWMTDLKYLSSAMTAPSTGGAD